MRVASVRAGGARRAAGRWHAPCRWARGQRGFSLLEVVVALAILSVAVVAAMEVFSGSLRLADKASRRTRAVAYGQEIMDRLFEAEMLADGEERGETDDGYRWVSTVTETVDEDGRYPGPGNLPVQLKSLEVRVSWEGRGGMQELALRSLRMVKVLR